MGSDYSGAALFAGNKAGFAKTVTAVQGVDVGVTLTHPHRASNNYIKRIVDLTFVDDLVIGCVVLPDRGVDDFPYFRFRELVEEAQILDQLELLEPGQLVFLATKVVKNGAEIGGKLHRAGVTLLGILGETTVDN